MNCHISKLELHFGALDIAQVETRLSDIKIRQVTV